jgi:membrane-associated phospholipid phosphatase
LFSYGYFTNNASYKEKAITTGTAIALNVVITYGLKYSINRQRPYLTYPDIDNVITESSRSMPSGHTSIAFATATSLSLNFPKWYVAVPAYSWASMVAYSRMHLGVHYPSDILVGALVGSGCAYFSYKANQWIRKKYQ